MAEKMGTARLTELLAFMQSDIQKWTDQDRMDAGVLNDLTYYLTQCQIAAEQAEDQIYDLAGYNAQQITAPRRDFLVSRELDAEAEVPGRQPEDEEPEPKDCPVCHMVTGHKMDCPQRHADALLQGAGDPHPVYRRKGQQRPEWSQ